MTDLQFDKQNRKYYVEENNKKRYLNQKDKVNIISFGNLKNGIIYYSHFISNNYYLLLENENYIPLFAVQQLEIIN